LDYCQIYKKHYFAAKVVDFLVVEPAHTGTRIFLDFIPGFNGTILLVAGDMPVDSDAPVVTSSIFSQKKHYFASFLRRMHALLRYDFRYDFFSF
jgi:hypothetical protein